LEKDIAVYFRCIGCLPEVLALGQRQMDNHVCELRSGKIKGKENSQNIHINTNSLIIMSATLYKEKPGGRFRGWKYATIEARIGDGEVGPVCLDTGAQVSLIDRTLALQSGLQLKPNSAARSGALEGNESSEEFVIFKLFIPGVKNDFPVIACIELEAHVVNSLPFRLRLGTDILTPESVTIDLGRRLVNLGSCENVIVPVTVGGSEA